MYSRYEILLESYNKVINIEALTMLDMAKKEIGPAVTTYVRELCDTVIAKKTIGIDELAEQTIAEKIAKLESCFYKKIASLEDALCRACGKSDALALAQYSRDTIIPAMQELRAVADELETNVAEDYWPMPTYGDLLFGV